MAARNGQPDAWGAPAFDGTLAKLNECFLSFGIDPAENIARLTALCADALGAVAARFERAGERAAAAAPPVSDGRTVVGQPVYWSGEPIGRLDAIFEGERVLGEREMTLLRMLGGAIAIEESRRRAAEALREREEEFREALKMEAVGRLAGGVAHSFNNLLTAVLGYAELLGANPSLDARARADVEEIKRAALAAAGLTRRLLAFGRRQVLQPVALDLGDVIARFEGFLRRLLGADTQLVLALAPGVPRVRADRSQIEQVLLTLAANACEAMPAGGALTIATAPANGGASVELSVRDTGCGMDRETIAHLFEPFFTTKGVGIGTGLGLAAVYGIVKQSGGDVLVESEPGAGTCFRITLPAVPAATAS